MISRPGHIVPAVLAKSASDFRRLFALARGLSPEVHVDVMDGQFVKTRSVGLSVLPQRLQKPRLEIHLMVDDPVSWLRQLHARRGTRVVLHPESQDVPLALAYARSRGWQPVLAVQPSTAVRSFARLLRSTDGLQVMGVRPGSYGGRFLQHTPRLVRRLRQRFPEHSVSVDGGVSLKTFVILWRAGATRFVIGSRLLQSRQPRRAWRDFSTLINSNAKAA